MRSRTSCSDRPAFGDQPVEHPPHERVVSGEQVLGAGGEGVGDIVPIEEEHDGREREHGEHAGAPLNPLGEHRENDEEVDREEGERERDRIESSSTGEVAGTLMPSLSADAASPTSPATEQNPTARFSPQERLTK